MIIILKNSQILQHPERIRNGIHARPTTAEVLPALLFLSLSFSYRCHLIVSQRICLERVNERTLNS